MPTALSVLSSLGFSQLRPGENDGTYKFSGPGVVVLACEDKKSPPGEIRFSLITALCADNDALEVAKRLLIQKWSCEGYVFAMLASVKDKSARLNAVAALSPMCKAGT